MGERRHVPGRIQQIEPYYLGLSQLFDRSPDAVIVGEAGSGRVVLWNPAASRLFGYSQEEAHGLLIEDLVPDELRERHRAGMERYARTGSGPLLEAQQPIELPARRKDGTEVHVELTLSPVENGRLSGKYVLAIVRDITERMRAEEHRRRAEQEQTSFIANAAHELRTPLTTICGFVSLIAERRRELSDVELDEFFSVLKRTGDRVNRLIADLLDLSQLEHGPAPIELQPVDVHHAVRAALEITPAPAGTSVTVDLPAGARAMADEDRLVQIIVNLLTNAYRYGGRRVAITGEEREGRFVLAVTDDGRGIPPEVVPHLFEPFTRATVARAHEGSGLGLTITRRLVEMFGGEITYRDADPGARFELHLPRPPERG